MCALDSIAAARAWLQLYRICRQSFIPDLQRMWEHEPSAWRSDQTLYWAQTGVDGNTYEIDQSPVILRGNQDSAPDRIVQQCSSAQCQPVYNTTMLNDGDTGGKFPGCSTPGSEGTIVCNPVNGETIYSPVSFEAAATGFVPMRDMEVWVDGEKMSEEITATLTTHLSTAASASAQERTTSRSSQPAGTKP